MFQIIPTQAKRALAIALLVPMIAACGGAGTATNATTAPAAGSTAAPAAATAMVEPTAMVESTAMAEPTAMVESTAMAESTAAPEATASGATGAMVELPVVDPATVTGDFVAAGSSTVFPLTERMVERFREDGYAGNPVIESIGSGAGIERFCNKETDIANASRAMKDKEKATCEAAGVPAVEFRVGTDALTIVTSAENDFITDITIEQLNQIFSGAVTTWDQVDPSYPAEAIQVFSPGSDSGTFDYFVEVVFADDDEGAAKVLKTPGIQLSEDDNVLVQGVEGSPYAIGYFGYAYFNENKAGLKALSVDGVEPNEETAESGDYPISRPLFIYSSPAIMTAKPQVASFINYYLTNVNDEILDVGYFPASEELLNEAKTAWTEASGS